MGVSVFHRVCVCVCDNLFYNKCVTTTVCVCVCFLSVAAVLVAAAPCIELFPILG